MKLKQGCSIYSDYGLNISAEEYADEGVPIIRTSDVDNSGTLDLSNTKYVEPHVVGTKRLRKGDVLFSRSGTIGRAMVFDADVEATYAAYLVRFRPHHKRLLSKFIGYWAQSAGYWHQIGADTIQSTIGNFNANKFANLSIPEHDLATQRQIADFLDRETARIDLLIEKKQRLVALLGEKFHAFRHKAITKGVPTRYDLDHGPNQWFDKVPTTWMVKPLRHVVLFQRGHDLPSDARTEGKYPIFSSGGLSGTHSTFSSRAPGIVTGRYGTIGKFHFVEEDYWALNTSLYSRAIYENPKFVFYLLEELAHIFILNSSKSAVPGVDRNDIHSELVPVPPREEQTKIVENLDRLKGELGVINAKTNASIDRLKEYRSALITAAVTGQFDVQTYAKSGTSDRSLDAIQEEMGA